MKKWVIKSGIQRKYLRYIMGLLLLAILLSSIGVWIYVRQSLTTEVTDKYEFLNEKMALDTLSKEADEGTAECITYDQVQESLKKASFADVEKNSLQKYFAYMNLDHVAEYCYVDNKNNVYARSYSHIDYEDFRQPSGRLHGRFLCENTMVLGEGYSVWDGERSIVYRKICTQHGIRQQTRTAAHQDE